MTTNTSDQTLDKKSYRPQYKFTSPTHAWYVLTYLDGSTETRLLKIGEVVENVKFGSQVSQCFEPNTKKSNASQEGK